MERNICDKCEKKPHILSMNLADFGKCSKCGVLGDCWDQDLIKFYREFSLTDEQIFTNLPRLLNPNLRDSSSENLAKIGLCITKLLPKE